MDSEMRRTDTVESVDLPPAFAGKNEMVKESQNWTFSLSPRTMTDQDWREVLGMTLSEKRQQTVAKKSDNEHVAPAFDIYKLFR
jgi:hypothetical protein